MTRTHRRVVTGHDADGKAVVISDAPATDVLKRDNRPGVTLTNYWQTFETPARFDGPEETLGDKFVLHPPKNGTVFRTITFEPENPEVLAKLDGPSAFAEMGAGANIVRNARHPFMHRTDSVDYAIVISGKIKHLMDDPKDDVTLEAGDVLVQRGTNHAWSNQFDEPCTIVFVLVHGEGDVPGVTS